MRFCLLVLTGIFVNLLVAQDTIEVRNSVHFGKYQDANGTEQDQVSFRLTVYNLGASKIPNLGATNRSQYVHFYINDEQSDPLSLFNGTEAVKDEYVILPGENESFDNRWVLSDDAGIVEQYGNSFYVHWEYMGIKSNKIWVDLEKKTSANESPKDYKIRREVEEQLNYLVSQADSHYRNKNYQSALDLYIRANHIKPEDQYVKQQIKSCKENLAKD